MKLYTLALLTFGFHGAAQTLPSTGVAIFMQFENQPSARAMRLMQQETGALLARAGVVPSFHQWPGAGVVNGFVIRFKGACRTGLGMAAAVGEMAPFGPATVRLAATKTRGAEVLPFAEVECDAVRMIAETAPVRDRAAAMGQALGRVVAHELYHLLWQKKGHAEAGLAKAVLSWRELLEATLELDGLGVMTRQVGTESGCSDAVETGRRCNDKGLCSTSSVRICTRASVPGGGSPDGGIRGPQVAR